MSNETTDITLFGSTILKDRYLQEGETIDGLFDRITDVCVSVNHKNRMLSYLRKFYFVPATPVLSNLGTDRGLPISCYLNNVDDSLDSIIEMWTENAWLGAKGGGIGTCFSDLRGAGETIKGRGGSSGAITFMKVCDAETLAISQGSLRRGASAIYLDVSHPEIEEFLEIRKPSGDFNRKCFTIHQGITIPDAFMEAVEDDREWDLIDPHTKVVAKSISARQLWEAIVETRMQTGEPYLIFIDAVNRSRPEHHKVLGLTVRQSNLCSEITLPTGIDHRNRQRTAVCCLGSLNLERFDSWKDDPMIIEDCLEFLDLVLQDFIDKAASIKGFDKAVYSASRERSVGLGVMGFHSYLQKNGIPFESAVAKSVNFKMFKLIHAQAEHANQVIAASRGPCADWEDAQVHLAIHGTPEDQIALGSPKRFSYTTAVAPTANISIIAGGCSPGIEPFPTNVFTQKTLSGSFEVKNKYLKTLLESKGKNTSDVWDSIIENLGSVQHLDFLDENEKFVFKTAFEIDQRWLVDFAADRTPYIEQSQSLNLFLLGEIDKFDLLTLHFDAWKKGVKSLYYLRSLSIGRPAFAPNIEEKQDGPTNNGEECPACQ